LTFFNYPGRALERLGAARGFGIDGKTIASYLGLLVDLLLVRRLEPRSGNVGNRLVTSPS